MNKTLAQIISYLFHPLIMPTLGVSYIFYSGSYISFMPSEVKKIILIVISANTFGLPLLVIPLFYQFGVIKSYTMETNRERVLPLAFTLIPYIFSVYFIYRIPLPNVIGTFILGASAIVGVALIVSLKWKISLHLLATGGLVGFLIAFSLKFYIDVFLPLLVLLFISGILASARLLLSTHKPSQIYVGFVTGFILMFLTITYF